MTFHVTSNTSAVQVIGCVNFGGSISVDASLPKSLSNITLMVFNCSTGNFSNLYIDTDDQFCSHTLNYLSHALVLVMDVDCQRSDDSTVHYLWILQISAMVVVPIVAIVIGIVIYLFVKPKKSLESKIDDLSSSDAPYQKMVDE